MRASVGCKARVVLGTMAAFVVMVCVGCGDDDDSGGDYTYTGRTVEIGGLTWMAENLNRETSNSWCYGNDNSNCAKYGRLYTWNAAMTACPSGWRLPDTTDWNRLVTAAGGSEVAGSKLKSQTGWDNNGNGTDEFGFSALPGGYRNTDGTFSNAYMVGVWWSATEDWWSGSAYLRNIGLSIAVSENNGYRNSGFSVRCVR